MASKSKEQQWDTVIRPRNGWFDINFRELLRYRDLIFLLVKRNVTLLYKQTVLGHCVDTHPGHAAFAGVHRGLWRIASLPTDGMPQFLFYMAGNIIWAYFSNVLKQCSTTFLSNHSLFGKVYFPRLAMPLSVVFSKLFNFFVQFLLFAAFWAYFAVQPGTAVHPNWQLVAFVPLVLLQVGMLGMGLGIIISSLTTRYRDLNLLVNLGVTLWIVRHAHRLPGLHGDGEVPPSHRPVHAQPGHAHRGVLPRRIPGHGGVQPGLHAPVCGMTLVFFTVGILLFSRIEKTFMDTV